MSEYICSVCKKVLDGFNAYEYRGAISCEEHHEEMIKNRNYERQKIIQEESRKTDIFRGLDLSDSKIGKANREILKPQIEIASKESLRLREYEGRK